MSEIVQQLTVVVHKFARQNLYEIWQVSVEFVVRILYENRSCLFSFGYKYLRIPAFTEFAAVLTITIINLQSFLFLNGLQNWRILWNLFSLKFRTTKQYSFSEYQVKQVFLNKHPPLMISYCIYDPLMKSDNANDRIHYNKNTSIFAIKTITRYLQNL